MSTKWTNEPCKAVMEHQTFELVDLAVDVCRQVMLASSSRSSIDPSETPSKRARQTEAASPDVWGVSIASLHTESVPDRLMDRLQFCCVLLEKYPDSLPQATVAPLVKALLKHLEKSDAHPHSHIHVVCAWALRCLKSALEASKLHNVSDPHQTRLWQLVWSAVLVKLKERAPGDSLRLRGFDLLAALVDADVVSPDADVWRLRDFRVEAPLLMSPAALFFVSTVLHREATTRQVDSWVRGKREQLGTWLADATIAERESDHAPCSSWHVAQAMVLLCHLQEPVALLKPISPCLDADRCSWSERQRLSEDELDTLQRTTACAFVGASRDDHEPEVLPHPGALDAGRVRHLFDKLSSTTQRLVAALSPARAHAGLGSPGGSRTRQTLLQLRQLAHHCAVVAKVLAMLRPVVLQHDPDAGTQASPHHTPVAEGSFGASILLDNHGAAIVTLAGALKRAVAQRRVQDQGTFHAFMRDCSDTLWCDAWADTVLPWRQMRHTGVGSPSAGSNRGPSIVTAFAANHQADAYRKLAGAVANTLSLLLDEHQSQAPVTVMEVDPDFDIPLPGASGGASAGPGAAASAGFSLQPSKDVDVLRLLCIDVLHGWRLVVVTEPTGVFDDLGAKQLVKLLSDPTAPLCCAVAACRSLVSVPARVEEDAAKHACAVLHAITCSRKENGLIHDPNFSETCFRVFVLEILADMAPTVHATTQSLTLDSIVKDKDGFQFLLGKFHKMLRGHKKDVAYTVFGTLLNRLERQAFATCIASYLTLDAAAEWIENAKVNHFLLKLLHKLARDRHQLVRLHVAPLIGDVYRALPTELATIAFGDLASRFRVVLAPVRDDDDADITILGMEDEIWDSEMGVHRSSALVTLSEVAAACPEVEKSALYLVLREWLIYPKIVRRLVTSVAARLGFRSAAAMLETMLPFFVNKWLDAKMHLVSNLAPDGAFDSFPAYLFGTRYQCSECHWPTPGGMSPCWESHAEAFAEDHMGHLMAAAVCCRGIHGDWQAAEFLGARVGQRVEGLLKEHFPRIIAQLLPLHDKSTADNVLYRSALLEKLPAKLGLSAHETTMLLTRHSTEVLLHLFSFVETQALSEGAAAVADDVRFVEQSEPSVSPAAAEGCLHVLAGKLKLASVSQLLCHDADSAQQLLLQLASRLARQHRLAEQLCTLEVFRFAVQLLNEDDQLCRRPGPCSPSNFRDAVLSLTRVMRTHPFTLPPCCEILHLLCASALKHCPEELADVLEAVVTALVANVPSALPGELDVWSRHAAPASLLDMLITKSEPALLDAIGLLEPFPPDAVLTLAADAQANARGTISLAEHIRRFATSRSSLCLSSRLENLGHILRQLADEKSQLKQVPLPDIAALLRELQRLVAGSTNRAVRQLVGRCVGELGLVGFESVALPVAPVAEPEVSRRSRHRLAGSETLRRDLDLVCLVERCLLDADIDVVEVASHTLKWIARTQRGQDVVKVLPAETTAALKPFFQSKRARPPPTLKTLFTRFPEAAALTWTVHVFDPSLWFPGNEAHTRVVGAEGAASTLASASAPSHADWLRRLTILLLLEANGDVGGLNDVLKACLLLCWCSLPVCEAMFAAAIHETLLYDPKQNNRHALSQLINQFFQHAAKGLVCGESLQTMLSVVHYLRQRERLPTVAQGTNTSRRPKWVHTHWDNLFWLELDFLAVAKASAVGRDHFAAVFFVEVWLELDAAAKAADRDEKRRLLLIDCFANIGEPDSLYGVNNQSLDVRSHIRTFEHEAKWMQALSRYDNLAVQPSHSSTLAAGAEAAQRQAANPTSIIGTCTALLQLNLHHVTQHYVAGLGLLAQTAGLQRHSSAPPEQLAEYRHQAAWRQTLWTDDQATSQQFGLGDEGTYGFHGTVLECVEALRRNQTQLVLPALNEARGKAVEGLVASSLASTTGISSFLVEAQCLAEVDELAAAWPKQSESVGSQGETLPQLRAVFDRWHLRAPDLDLYPFESIETIVSLRCVLLKTLRSASTPGSDVEGACSEELTKMLCSLADIGRSSGRLETAFGAAAALRRIAAPLAASGAGTWVLEEAKTYWASGEHELALSMLDGLVQLVEDHGASLVQAKALRLYGSWLAETRTKSPRTIIDQYLNKAARHLDPSFSLEHRAELYEAHSSLAQYSDTQYQVLVDKMRSADYESARLLSRSNQAELARLRHAVQNGSRELILQRRIKTLEKRARLEQAQEQRLIEDRNNFLRLAMEHYAEVLRGESYDLMIYRLCSLWFENEESAAVNELVENHLPKVPSHKWLPLMYQLAARLSASGNSAFQSTLRRVIERTAWDHPHHALPVLIALRNGERSTARSHGGGKRKKTSRRGSHVLAHNQDKFQAASAMIEALRVRQPTQSTRHRKLDFAAVLASLESLSDAYMELANVPPEEMKLHHRELQSTFTLGNKLRDCSGVSVLTRELPVDPSCMYDDVVGVDRFAKGFTFAGGINLPRIIDCFGTDGLPYKQVIKGNDDLRQDAVMQQVFRTVNVWLAQKTSSKLRNLSIRTYKCVPLSQQSGVLEWCMGTQPIGEWLVRCKDVTPAHIRYRPDDWTSNYCRQQLKDALPFSTEAERAEPESLFSVFQNIERNFKPVMRRFFTEHFHNPADWFERRLAYTRSCAVNSMVGYILGLGDRHPHNILIDKHSAEIVHIDLGVAFDQGKMLRTPETVPFRLTRDIVDGMGVAGVEGVFRRCCQESLALLRSRKLELLTILEVFLYDPLYSWKLTPEKTMHIQPMEEGEEGRSVLDSAVPGEPVGVERAVSDGGDASGAKPAAGNVRNSEAYRVLLQLQQKLQGSEGGLAPLSVSGHVNHLIQEATSEDNLCRLFPGWQPWV
eukprot:m.297594 g.297594  ORF g.297594 m.297594 type:complete len:2835 (+) comp19529_c0_seq5:1447-9951(+)